MTISQVRGYLRNMALMMLIGFVGGRERNQPIFYNLSDSHHEMGGAVGKEFERAISVQNFNQ